LHYNVRYFSRPRGRVYLATPLVFSIPYCVWLHVFALFSFCRLLWLACRYLCLTPRRLLKSFFHPYRGLLAIGCRECNTSTSVCKWNRELRSRPIPACCCTLLLLPIFFVPSVTYFHCRVVLFVEIDLFRYAVTICCALGLLSVIGFGRRHPCLLVSVPGGSATY